MLIAVAAGIAGVIAPAIGYFPALGHDRPDLGPVRAFVGLPGVARSAAISAGTGLAATLLSVAATAAVLAALYGTRGLARVARMLAPVVAVPHAAAAIGFVALFSPSGLILRTLAPLIGLDVPPDVALVRDPWGFALVAALVMKEVPFLLLMALAALPQARPAERMAIGRALGYGPMAAFLHGVWPLVYRQIRLPVLAVLAFSASVVDVALILGPTRPPPLGVKVLTLFQSADLSDWLVGAAGAVAMLLLTLALLLAWRLIERVAGALMRLGRNGARWRRDRVPRNAIGGLAVGGAAVAFTGLGALGVQSVAGYWPFPDLVPQTVSGTAWARLPADADVLLATLGIASGATMLSLPAAVVLLMAGIRAGALVYLPLLVPQVAFLFGLAVLGIGAGIAPGPLAVTLVHALFTLPYVVIVLSGPWAALDPRYEATAASLGIPAWRRLVTVRLAMLSGALFAAAALSVAVSVGLYLPTQLIGAGRVATITTEAVAAATGGDRRLTAMLALVQLLLPLLAFAVARAVPAVLFRDRRLMASARFM